MMNVSLIKQLRLKTGAGLSDCRKALEETNNDLKKAEKLLLVWGVEKAEKKIDREMKSGWIGSYVHSNGKTGAMVALACETDFAAKTPDFQNLAHDLAMQVCAMNPKDVDALLKQDFIKDGSKTIAILVKETSGKIGENVKIVDFKSAQI